jgi:hypothetical protein
MNVEIMKQNKLNVPEFVCGQMFSNLFILMLVKAIPL